MEAMDLLDLVCYLTAVILFVLAAFSVPSNRVVLGWLGLAFFAFVPLAHVVAGLT